MSNEQIGPFLVIGKKTVVIYTNWRGETAVRTITPKSIRFGATEWHPEPQWLLLADDAEKGEREFALLDMKPVQT
jgi:hypothetical protein